MLTYDEFAKTYKISNLVNNKRCRKYIRKYILDFLSLERHKDYRRYIKLTPMIDDFLKSEYFLNELVYGMYKFMLEKPEDSKKIRKMMKQTNFGCGDNEDKNEEYWNLIEFHSKNYGIFYHWEYLCVKINLFNHLLTFTEGGSGYKIYDYMIDVDDSSQYYIKKYLCFIYDYINGYFEPGGEGAKEAKESFEKLSQIQMSEE